MLICITREVSGIYKIEMLRVIWARLKFPSRESRLDVGQRICSCYWFPPFLGHPVEKEYRDDGREFVDPHTTSPDCAATLQTRARDTHGLDVVGRRRNETLQSGVPREYGPCERSKSWPTSLPGSEKLSPRAARAFTREPSAAGCTRDRMYRRDRGFPRSSSLGWCTVDENAALKISVSAISVFSVIIVNSRWRYLWSSWVNLVRELYYYFIIKLIREYRCKFCVEVCEFINNKFVQV